MVIREIIVALFSGLDNFLRRRCNDLIIIRFFFLLINTIEFDVTDYISDGIIHELM